MALTLLLVLASAVAFSNGGILLHSHGSGLANGGAQHSSSQSSFHESSSSEEESSNFESSSSSHEIGSSFGVGVGHGFHSGSANFDGNFKSDYSFPNQRHNVNFGQLHNGHSSASGPFDGSSRSGPVFSSSGQHSIWNGPNGGSSSQNSFSVPQSFPSQQSHSPKGVNTFPNAHQNFPNSRGSSFFHSSSTVNSPSPVSSPSFARPSNVRPQGASSFPSTFHGSSLSSHQVPSIPRNSMHHFPRPHGFTPSSSFMSANPRSQTSPTNPSNSEYDLPSSQRFSSSPRFSDGNSPSSPSFPTFPSSPRVSSTSSQRVPPFNPKSPGASEVSPFSDLNTPKTQRFSRFPSNSITEPPSTQKVPHFSRTPDMNTPRVQNSPPFLDDSQVNVPSSLNQPSFPTRNSYMNSPSQNGVPSSPGIIDEISPRAQKIPSFTNNISGNSPNLHRTPSFPDSNDKSPSNQRIPSFPSNSQSFPRAFKGNSPNLPKVLTIPDSNGNSLINQRVPSLSSNIANSPHSESPQSFLRTPNGNTPNLQNNPSFPASSAKSPENQRFPSFPESSAKSPEIQRLPSIPASSSKSPENQRFPSFPESSAKSPEIQRLPSFPESSAKSPENQRFPSFPDSSAKSPENQRFPSFPASSAKSPENQRFPSFPASSAKSPENQRFPSFPDSSAKSPENQRFPSFPASSAKSPENQRFPSFPDSSAKSPENQRFPSFPRNSMMNSPSSEGPQSFPRVSIENTPNFQNNPSFPDSSSNSRNNQIVPSFPSNFNANSPSYESIHSPPRTSNQYTPSLQNNLPFLDSKSKSPSNPEFTSFPSNTIANKPSSVSSQSFPRIPNDNTTNFPKTQSFPGYKGNSFPRNPMENSPSSEDSQLFPSSSNGNSPNLPKFSPLPDSNGNYLNNQGVPSFSSKKIANPPSSESTQSFPSPSNGNTPNLHNNPSFPDFSAISPNNQGMASSPSSTVANPPSSESSQSFPRISNGNTPSIPGWNDDNSINNEKVPTFPSDAIVNSPRPKSIHSFPKSSNVNGPNQQNNPPILDSIPKSPSNQSFTSTPIPSKAPSLSHQSETSSFRITDSNFPSPHKFPTFPDAQSASPQSTQSSSSTPNGISNTASMDKSPSSQILEPPSWNSDVNYPSPHNVTSFPSISTNLPQKKPSEQPSPSNVVSEPQNKIPGSLVKDSREPGLPSSQSPNQADRKLENVPTKLFPEFVSVTERPRDSLPSSASQTQSPKLPIDAKPSKVINEILTGSEILPENPIKLNESSVGTVNEKSMPKPQNLTNVDNSSSSMPSSAIQNSLEKSSSPSAPLATTLEPKVPISNLPTKSSTNEPQTSNIINSVPKEPSIVGSATVPEQQIKSKDPIISNSSFPLETIIQVNSPLSTIRPSESPGVPSVPNAVEKQVAEPSNIAVNSTNLPNPAVPILPSTIPVVVNPEASVGQSTILPQNVENSKVPTATGVMLTGPENVSLKQAPTTSPPPNLSRLSSSTMVTDVPTLVNSNKEGTKLQNPEQPNDSPQLVVNSKIPSADQKAASGTENVSPKPTSQPDVNLLTPITPSTVSIVASSVNIPNKVVIAPNTEEPIVLPTPVQTSTIPTAAPLPSGGLENSSPKPTIETISNQLSPATPSSVGTIPSMANAGPVQPSNTEQPIVLPSTGQENLLLKSTNVPVPSSLPGQATHSSVVKPNKDDLAVPELHQTSPVKATDLKYPNANNSSSGGPVPSVNSVITMTSSALPSQSVQGTKIPEIANDPGNSNTTTGNNTGLLPIDGSIPASTGSVSTIALPEGQSPTVIALEPGNEPVLPAPGTLGGEDGIDAGFDDEEDQENVPAEGAQGSQPDSDLALASPEVALASPEVALASPEVALASPEVAGRTTVVLPVVRPASFFPFGTPIFSYQGLYPFAQYTPFSFAQYTPYLSNFLPYMYPF